MKRKLYTGVAVGIFGVFLCVAGASGQQALVKPATIDTFAATAEPPRLTDETYEYWRDYIVPSPEELRWQQIPWQPTWTEAFTQAKKENKPIYVFAMNGHPLGNC